MVIKLFCKLLVAEVALPEKKRKAKKEEEKSPAGYRCRSKTFGKRNNTNANANNANSFSSPFPFIGEYPPTLGTPRHFSNCNLVLRAMFPYVVLIQKNLPFNYFNSRQKTILPYWIDGVGRNENKYRTKETPNFIKIYG